MLKIDVPDIDLYDDEKNEFVTIKGQTLSLEHSLVSISKWESKWKKHFIDNGKNITNEEMQDYIRCMTLTQNVNPDIYKYLPPSILQEILDYIEDPHTATWFAKTTGSPNREIFTSEKIYAQMVILQIPFECQKWHINRLLTLIRVTNELNNPKKMSKTDIFKQNKSINAMRRAAMRTKG